MPLNWFQRLYLRLRGFPIGDGRSVTVLTSSGTGAPAPELKRQPDRAELLKDVAPARWIVERLQKSTPQTGTLVKCIIPQGLEAYARIFHPAKQYNAAERSWSKVRWTTVASWNGKVVHPQMEFSPIANLDHLRHDDPSWGTRPEDGALPEDECRHLLGVLEEFTNTPERCYSGIWHGFGELNNPFHEKWPTLDTPDGGRKYFIFRGPADGVMSFYEWIWNQSPNLWWPEDRAWFVATEIDFNNTFVGGSAACIERVLAHPELEALPIAIDARVDVYGDTINV